MNLKTFTLFSLLFFPHHAPSQYNAKALLQSGKKIPPALKHFWWNGGDTPLHMAALNNDEAHARRLLKAGADVNVRNDGGETPLFHAVQLGDIPMAKLLMEYNANLLARDREGATPLNRLMQSPQRNEDLVALFLTRLGFRPDNTCGNQDYLLAATGPSIRFFQKNSGAVATYIPTLRGRDGLGNHRFQTLVEDHIYPDTIRVVLDLEWDHEARLIRGRLVFEDFSPSDFFVTMTHLNITDLPCPWEQWEQFLSIPSP